MMGNDKAIGCIGKIASIVGVLCYFFAALGVTACLAKGFVGEDIGFILLFAICGAFLRAGVKKMRKKAGADTKPGNDSKEKCRPRPGEPKTVQCPNCGANNTIYGNIGECEYCGSGLRPEGKK